MTEMEWLARWFSRLDPTLVSSPKNGRVTVEIDADAFSELQFAYELTNNSYLYTRR